MVASEPSSAHPATPLDAGLRGRIPVPRQGRSEPGGSLCISPLPGGCWRVCGEVDLHNDDEWVAALDELVLAAAGVRLDLADLEFISARGVRQLVSASEKLPAGERIEVISSRPLFRRVLDSGWPNGVSGLLVVEGKRP